MHLIEAVMAVLSVIVGRPGGVPARMVQLRGLRDSFGSSLCNSLSGCTSRTGGGLRLGSRGSGRSWSVLEWVQSSGPLLEWMIGATGRVRPRWRSELLSGLGRSRRRGRRGSRSGSGGFSRLLLLRSRLLGSFLLCSRLFRLFRPPMPLLFLLTMTEGVLRQILHGFHLEFHLAGCMIGVFWEVALTRAIILVLAELMANVLSRVELGVLIMVDASFFIHIIIVRVTLRVLEIEQVVSVVNLFKIVVASAAVVIEVCIVIMYDRHLLSMNHPSCVRDGLALPFVRIRTALLVREHVRFFLDLSLLLNLLHLAILFLLFLPLGRAEVFCGALLPVPLRLLSRHLVFVLEQITMLNLLVIVRFLWVLLLTALA